MDTLIPHDEALQSNVRYPHRWRLTGWLNDADLYDIEFGRHDGGRLDTCRWHLGARFWPQPLVVRGRSA